MTHLVLHNPQSRAHLEDLMDRLSAAVAAAGPDPRSTIRAEAVVATLAEVVRAMDQGAIGADRAAAVFTSFRLPGFRFDRWLDEMVDEGIYLKTPLALAA